MTRNAGRASAARNAIETERKAARDKSGRSVTVCEITDQNWREVADIAPRDDQRRFVAALAARYLLLSMRGTVWTSLAVTADDAAVVGHVMWAYDKDDDAHWIGGMLIAVDEQGKGVGRLALRATVATLSALPHAREIRLSYHPDNVVAAGLYTAEGFRPTGEHQDGEIVVALPVAHRA